jgi:CBS domain-containing protein
MRKSPPTLSAQMRVEDAIQQTRSGQFRVWPVVDKAYFLGIVTRETLEFADDDGKNEQPVADLVDTSQVPHVHTDHALHYALERMSKYHLDVLPVIHRADIHRLEGVVTLPDVLDAYGIDRIGSN